MDFSVDELYYYKNLSMISILRIREKIVATVIIIILILAISGLLMILSTIYTNRIVEYILY
ncbi:hypothetical protein HAHI6034_11740 [Hathewaya histolytica]|uniref:Uncharacterized protein n=1 Tax=Hathewaya histolytica TaxID=1498 RepID=A0A4U9RB68_HATHI|nr:hypothetical protein [Hathewaya histolytica]VTQ88945.1 Uncharacterised protein [Hathewaya histolytica]